MESHRRSGRRLGWTRLDGRQDSFSGSARPGTVFVSQTVKDLVAGSGIRFTDAGLHMLKGLPEEWRLHEAIGQ
jgi:hypothetical protein